MVEQPAGDPSLDPASPLAIVDAAPSLAATVSAAR